MFIQKEEASVTPTPNDIKSFLEEFDDLSEELLKGLSPMHVIQQAINLLSGLSFPNLPYYAMHHTRGA